MQGVAVFLIHREIDTLICLCYIFFKKIERLITKLGQGIDIEAYKKAFFEDGFLGIIFLASGLILQFDGIMPDVVWGLFSLLSAILVIAILVMIIRYRKKLREPVDESAKISILYAESMMYKLISFFILVGSLLMQFVFKDKIQVILNWNICLIFLGSCNLIYCLVLKLHENKNKERDATSCLKE